MNESILSSFVFYTGPLSQVELLVERCATCWPRKAESFSNIISMDFPRARATHQIARQPLAAASQALSVARWLAGCLAFETLVER